MTALTPRQAWTVVATLVGVSLVAYVDLQVVAVLVTPIKADLGLDDGRIGLLYGVFAVFYAFAGIPVARLSDRRSRKHLIAAGLVLWSAMTMLGGLSRTFTQLLLARIGMGVGMAVLTPAATSLIADCFPRERTALAVSVFQTGAVVGSGLAFVFGAMAFGVAEARGVVHAGPLGSLLPWQQVMVMCGVPGFLLAPWLLSLPEPRHAYVSAPKAVVAPWPEVRAFYRENAATLALHHLGFLSLAFVGFGVVFWFVTFLTRVHGLLPATAARDFGWIYLVAGSAGSLAAPMLASRLTQSGRADANIVAAIVGGLGATLAIVGTQLMPTPGWALLWLVPAMFFVASPFGLAYGSLPVITPPPMRAVVTSVYMFVVNLGMLLGPPLTGWLNERVFPGHAGVRWSLLALTACCGVTGLVLLTLARVPYARSLAVAEARALAARA